MKLQKYLLLTLCNSLFRFSIYAIALSVTFVSVFDSPDSIKRALLGSNAYSRFVPSIIETNVKDNKATGSLPLKDPQIQKIIENSFPAPVLQHDTETIIDSVYGWLRGETPRPEFSVDFAPNLDKLSNDLSNYAFNRLSFQPICGTEPATIDPFTATCRPEFFDINGEQKHLAELIRSDKGILPQTKFTTDDLPKNSQGQTLLQQYAYAPTAYKFMHYSPWIFSLLALLSGAVMVLSNRKWRKTISSLGLSVVGSSIFTALSPLVFLYVLPHFFPALAAQSSGNPTQVVLGDVVTRLSTEFNNQLILMGVLMVLIGAGIVVAERGSRPKSKYIKVSKKAGVISSNEPRTRKGKAKVTATNLPVQTSEGTLRSSKYQKDKRYRNIPKGDL